MSNVKINLYLCTSIPLEVVVCRLNLEGKKERLLSKLRVETTCRNGDKFVDNFVPPSELVWIWAPNFLPNLLRKIN